MNKYFFVAGRLVPWTRREIGSFCLHTVFFALALFIVTGAEAQTRTLAGIWKYGIGNYNIPNVYYDPSPTCSTVQSLFQGTLCSNPDYYQQTTIVSTAPPACVINMRCISDSTGQQVGPGGNETFGYTSTVSCPTGYNQTSDGNCQINLNSEDVDKSSGKPMCGVGNPCNPGTGGKFQKEEDYVGAGEFPLAFERFHDSRRPATQRDGRRAFGPTWTHSYAGYVELHGSGSLFTAYVGRPDGKLLYFSASSQAGPWTSDADDATLLTRFTQGVQPKWKLISPDTDRTEIYDVQTGRLESISNRAGLSHTLQYDMGGRLASVTDAFGRSITFTYDSLNRISSFTDPAGGVTSFAYDGATNSANLQTVTYPGGAVRTYQYVTVASQSRLSAIIDENGVTFASWTYDANAKATSSQHAGDAEKVTLSYPDALQTTVATYVSASQSATRTYAFTILSGVKQLQSITGPACPSCGPKAIGYDANSNVSSTTDWNGVVTTYAYDLSRNLETARVEASATSQARTISTDWHSTFRLPTRIAEPLRITTNTFDPDGTQCGARGALCSRSVQATTDASGAAGFGATTTGTPRAWTYTYNINGRLLTENGPRADVSDVTTYTYYAANDSDVGKRGNLATVTNAMGHVTQVTAYNAHGQPTSITDPNGLVTTLTYDGRQRLTARMVGAETTTYDYDAAGLLTKVTMPDGAFLSYGYDGAHRLTSITDNLGNKIAYTLDLAGNRTAEEVRDSANALMQTRTRVYSSLNRLFQELGALGQTTEYTYDDQGNMLTVKDPLNRTTTSQYDARNRLSQVTDPAAGVVQYGYNGLSALTSVIDQRNLGTTYAMDGLGNMSSQVSPDTGTTVNTYDTAGNLATQTDAKGQVTSYAYDALNRVTLITFHDGSKQAYAYDSGTNGLGRLSSITETNPSNAVMSVIAYAYDSHGRVTSEARTVGGVTYTVAYSYDSSGRLSGMTYPSGRSVAYSFDALGRVNQVTTTKDSQTQVVVQNVAYHPFGGAKSWTLGNGQIYSRTIDQDGRIASYTLGGTSNAITYDAASRITDIAANTYGYDSLDRLTSAVLPTSNFGYSYDAVGNRLTKTTGANTDTYTYGTTSNRIATLTPSGSALKTFTLDSNGSTTSDAVNSFAYDTRGRMVQSTNAASLVTGYQVNALGQRIRKTNANEDRVFTYDASGKLIAESDPGGAPKREYIYLGDIPVGVLQ